MGSRIVVMAPIRNIVAAVTRWKSPGRPDPASWQPVAREGTATGCQCQQGMLPSGAQAAFSWKDVGPPEMTSMERSAGEPIRQALITGAGRGIGRAVAIALAAEGVSVTLLARGEADLIETARTIEEQGGKATVQPVDVTDDAALTDAFSRFPLHDIVVNAAGMNRPEPFLDASLETFDALFALNVRSVYAVTQHAVRRLVDAGRPGVIVNISSQMGHVGARNRTVYCASKHAIEGLTKALAVELAPLGIRVAAVAPTFVETSFSKPFLADPAFRREVIESIPLGRMATPEDVASAVVFLTSESAAMVTGTSLVVDGGWTAR